MSIQYMDNIQERMDNIVQDSLPNKSNIFKLPEIKGDFVYIFSGVIILIIIYYILKID